MAQTQPSHRTPEFNARALKGASADLPSPGLGSQAPIHQAVTDRGTLLLCRRGRAGSEAHRASRKGWTSTGPQGLALQRSALLGRRIV